MWRFNPSVIFLALVSGCIRLPPGPTVAVWPATGKPLEVFTADDAACRQFAAQSFFNKEENLRRKE